MGVRRCTVHGITVERESSGLIAISIPVPPDTVPRVELRDAEDESAIDELLQSEAQEPIGVTLRFDAESAAYLMRALQGVLA